MDPSKRRKYDSSLPFDETVPKEDEITNDNFFKLYRACFENNARFSTIHPIPDIGDMDTPIESVYDFYKFWDDFKTWREFSQYDEYDLDEAQDRYEKRWMEGQNKNLRSKYVKAERKRIINMVDLAYKLDPRIVAINTKKNAEKEAIKQAKKDAKLNKYKEAEDKKKAVEEAEAKAKEDKLKAEKEAKELKKIANRKYRETVKVLIAHCEEHMPETNYDRFYLDELVKKYPKQEDLDALVDAVKGITEPIGEKFVDAFL